MAHREIRTPAELAAYCRGLVRCKSIALDTEFVAERSYRPVLCLVQVVADGEPALIDPLAAGDMTPFWAALAEGAHETIVHAGRGEVEFCLEAVGRRPANLVDVQIAAGLAGIEYPAGYGTLITRLLKVSPDKHETRTDWRQRPLSKRQIEYAIEDVVHLPAVWEKLRERLRRLKRESWLADEMEEWQSDIERSRSQERWRRVSGNAGLSPRGLAVLRELWHWRESVAERRDCPSRRVLRDDLLIELARRQSADPKRIGVVRGLERGDLKRQLPALAERVQRALDLPEDDCPPRHTIPQTPPLSVLGQFLFAALGSYCRQNELAPSMLGTPNDLRDLIAYRLGSGWPARERPPALARGWRAQVAGKLLDDLLAGRLAVRVGDPRSEHPLIVERVDGQ